jgi:hypothetical protein
MRRLCYRIACWGAFVLAGFPSAALASGGGDGCNPGRPANATDYQAGAQVLPSGGRTYGAIEGRIRNYSPYVYKTSSYLDTTTQWVMLLTPHDLYQVGWWEQPYGKRFTFIEDANSSFTQGGTLFFSPDTINTVSNYKVAFRPPSTYAFYDGSKELRTVGQLQAGDPTYFEVNAETHNQASQMPGGSSNVDYAESVQAYYPAGPSGSYHPADFGEVGGDAYPPAWARVNVDSFTGESYTLYDTACTS